MEMNMNQPPMPLAGPPAPMPSPPPPGPPGPMPMEGGGPTTPKPKFFEGITLLDICIVSLASLTFFYSIYASRVTIKYYVNMQRQTSKELASLKSQVQDLTAGTAPPANS